MTKEVQSVRIQQSKATRYGTVQRALITAINNCMALGEHDYAKTLINIKDEVETAYNNVINAEIEWKVK